MSSDQEDYSTLTPEQREARDKEARLREQEEQAGMQEKRSIAGYLVWSSSNNISTALPYSWTQELGELDVTVPVPQGTRGKDLAIVIDKKKLSVGLKGREPIMSGELCKEIKVEDSTWTVRKYVDL